MSALSTIQLRKDSDTLTSYIANGFTIKTALFLMINLQILLKCSRENAVDFRSELFNWGRSFSLARIY